MMAESIIREYESYDYVTGAIPDFIQEGNNITDCMYRVLIKYCVFSQFTATPPSPTSLLETLKAFNAEQVYSHSYWLEIFCTTNSSRLLAREKWQTS